MRPADVSGRIDDRPGRARNGAPSANEQELQLGSGPRNRLGHALPKPYMSSEELALVTPWTVEAQRKMRDRGIFVLGKHYFRPPGDRSHVIYFWEAVVELIRSGTVSDQEAHPAAPGRDRGARRLDVEEAKKVLRGLRR